MTSHKRKKIAVIGAGFVGSTCAHWIAQAELGDVVLLDVNEGSAKGKALDLFSATPVEGLDVHIEGGSQYEKIKNADLVVVTAGIPRKPGMSRDDLLQTNAKIMTQVCTEIRQHAPHSIVIIVSNPLDAMAYIAKKTLNFEPHRIIGMAGVLDSARFKAFIAEKTNLSVKDIQAFVLGGHGDTMVPMVEHSSIGGVPLSHFLSHKEIEQIVERTRKGGAEIVSHLKTGSAYYAPSASVVQMAKAILKDQHRILPCAAYLNGEYGYSDIFLGVLCRLSGKGVEQIIELELNAAQKKELEQSANAVKDLVKAVEKISL